MTTAEERRLDALTEQQDAEVLAAEQAAAAAASAAVRRELEKLLAAAVVALEAMPEDGERSRLLTRVRTRLVSIEVGAAGVLRPEFERAVRLGMRQAFAQLGIRGRRFSVTVPAEIDDFLAQLDEQARGDIRAGAGLITREATPAEVEDAFARARQGVTRIERAATWGVNRSVASGVTAVADVEQTDRLWVGERDACVHCLAYFGEIVGPGASFPAGLTFGDKPLSRTPVVNPPLHPNCRCRITVWRGAWDDGYPAALKREARRSIARGWSLGSESQAVRLRAADRLLRRGAGLPKSVLDYAERAVRRGAFPRGRTFPG